MIPLVDLKKQAQNLRGEILPAMMNVIDNTDFILGNEVQLFEKAFAEYSQAKYCIGVANGTDALYLSFLSLDLPKGSEVIIPANTFAATAIGIIKAGLKPKLIDVHPDTYLLNAAQIKDCLNDNVKAICPVHLYGQLVDYQAINDVISAQDIVMVEDAAQAHGAFDNKDHKAGTVGSLGCFSFYPGKNLGAFGDAGAVLTNDDNLALKLKKLRNYGSVEKYQHPEFGINSRLDTIQAAILRIKLQYLKQWTQRRIELASRYVKLLTGVGDIILPNLIMTGQHVYHLFVIRTAQRNLLNEYLDKNGIKCGIHYPTPIHLHGAFSYLGYTVGDFPVTEFLAKEILSLPLYPEMTNEQQDKVIQAIQSFYTTC